MPRQSEGGRSSSMGCRRVAAHSAVAGAAPPPDGARGPARRSGRARQRSAGSAGYARSACSAPATASCWACCPSALLVTAGFTAIFIQAENTSPRRLHQPHAQPRLERVADLRRCCSSALCLAAHLVIRFALPDADPYLFPLAAVLASVGIVMVYRINPVAGAPAGAVDGASG